MSTPLAFLLTWRTYGTWLHGDERGSVDDTHNAFGTPLLTRNDARRARAAGLMRSDALLLTGAMRAVVDAALVDECTHRRWALLERAVRTNHVHAVVEYSGLDPDHVLQKLKARATRWLRERGHVARDRPVWADRPGSRRYLWTPEHVNSACAYVREGQDIPR